MTPPRLVCDEMLGRLARWLRLLGYDAAYMKDVEDAEVRARGVAEGRVVLTRDAALARAVPDPPGALRVRALDPMEQLEEVVDALGLAVPPDRVLSRCNACNVPVEPAAPEAVASEAPAKVRARHDGDAFSQCPRCRRVYWPGTHADEVERVARDLRGDLRDTDS